MEALEHDVESVRRSTDCQSSTVHEMLASYTERRSTVMLQLQVVATIDCSIRLHLKVNFKISKQVDRVESTAARSL
jgi:hypothetical protein